MRELTLAGAGVALRSLWDVSRDIGEGRLRRFLPAYEGSSDVGVFAVSASAPTAPAQALTRHLRAEFRRRPPA